VRPEALRAERRRLDGYERSASGLFDWLRARITREMLVQMSEADYGQEAGEHLAALLDIHTTGLVPVELAWHPAEVVSLTRWGCGGADVAGAWCCTLLWLCQASYDNRADTVPRIVDCALALGAEARLLAEQMFVWTAETEPRDLSGANETASVSEGSDVSDADTPDPYALLGLLFLRAAAEPEDPKLAELALTVSAAHGPGPLDCGISEEAWNALTTRIWSPSARVFPR
jgi:hypothetical protein